jgi:hypothetical protein
MTIREPKKVFALRLVHRGDGGNARYHAVSAAARTLSAMAKLALEDFLPIRRQLDWPRERHRSQIARLLALYRFGVREMG